MRKYVLILTAAIAIVAVYFSLSPMGPGQGDPAPVFSLYAMDGEKYDLDQLIAEKPLVLQFWAPWCSICRSELPKLLDAERDGKYNVVLIIPQKTEGLKLLSLVDSEQEAAKEYGVANVPQTFFIGRDGIIQKRVVGPVEY